MSTLVTIFLAIQQDILDFFLRNYLFVLLLYLLLLSFIIFTKLLFYNENGANFSTVYKLLLS
jgi:hypothetical protein